MPVWLLPALFAAAVAIGATVLIERMGGRRGGLIGTLPSTVVPAAIGIYAAMPSEEAFAAAMFITPAGMLVNGVFLYLWRVVPRWVPPFGLVVRLAWIVVLTLLGWGVLAGLMVLANGALDDAGIWLGIPGILLTVLLAVFGLWACQRNPPAPQGLRPVGVPTLMARGVFAGCAIGIAVVLAEQGGPLMAGIVAVFPAIFLTTMVSLWISQGEAVQAGAVGPMMLGATSVSVFALIAAWTVPHMGPAVGCLIAWLGAAVGVTIPAWSWLDRQRDAVGVAS